VERPPDLGSDGRDDRKLGAQAPMELKIDAAKWRAELMKGRES